MKLNKMHGLFSQNSLFNNSENGKKTAKKLLKIGKIGIKGKIKTSVNFSDEILTVLNNRLDEVSFRFLAYFIKGYFLNLNKNYEEIIKEVQYFIDGYVIVKNEMKEKKNNKKGKIIQKNLNPYSQLFSEFSELNKYINNLSDNSQFSQKLNKILKQKNFSDLKNLNEQSCKEYLKKIIKDQTSQTFSLKEFLDTIYGGNFEENQENMFENYMGYYLNKSKETNIDQFFPNKKSKKENNKEKENKISLNEIQELGKLFEYNCLGAKGNFNNCRILMNDVFDDEIQEQASFKNFSGLLVFGDEEILNKYSQNHEMKNRCFFQDSIINWKLKLPKFLIKKQKILDFDEEEEIKLRAENNEEFFQIANMQYIKFHKKILVNSYLETFKSLSGMHKSQRIKIKNQTNNKSQNSQNPTKMKISNVSLLEKNLFNLLTSSYVEQNDTLKKLHPRREESSIPSFDFDNDGQIREEKRIFNESRQFNSHELMNEKILFPSPEEANLSVFGLENNLDENIEAIKEHSSKNINDSIKKLARNHIENTTENQVFDLCKLSRHLQLNLESEFISSQESISLAFYNLLIICQTENIHLSQNKQFGPIIINKI